MTAFYMNLSVHENDNELFISNSLSFSLGSLAKRLHECTCIYLKDGDGHVKMVVFHGGGRVDSSQWCGVVHHKGVVLAAMIQIMAEAGHKEPQALKEGANKNFSLPPVGMAEAHFLRQTCNLLSVQFPCLCW